MLKKVLPKPKTFNMDFLMNQQSKLNEFRTQLRQLPKDVNIEIYLRNQIKLNWLLEDKSLHFIQFVVTYTVELF
jgi:hypothetical protein